MDVISHGPISVKTIIIKRGLNSSCCETLLVDADTLVQLHHVTQIVPMSFNGYSVATSMFV